jgi:hypothetical protein
LDATRLFSPRGLDYMNRLVDDVNLAVSVGRRWELRYVPPPPPSSAGASAEMPVLCRHRMEDAEAGYPVIVALPGKPEEKMVAAACLAGAAGSEEKEPQAAASSSPSAPAPQNGGVGKGKKRGKKREA